MVLQSRNLLLAVLLLSASLVVTARGIKGRQYKVHNTNKRGGVKGNSVRHLAKSREEPDVNNLDLSLFREHQEGFPGGLFYEDSEGEAQLEQLIPKWRQAGKASSKAGGGTGKGGTGKGTWNSRPCVPRPTGTEAPTGKSGKGSTKYCPPTIAPTAAPTVAPVSTSSSVTPASAASSKGVSKGADDPWDASEAECLAIAASSDLKDGGPTVAFNDPKLTFDAEFRIKSKNNLDVTALLDKYTKYARLYVLGCFAQANTELASITQRRRLVTQPLFQAIMDDWSEDSGSCKGTSPKTCNYANQMDTYYENSPNDAPNDKEIKDRLKDALKIIRGELEKNPDVDRVEVNDVKVAKAISGGDAVEEESDTKTIIAATAGVLGLLMLLMFLAKRNKGDDNMSHLKFEEDDDTFVREFEENSDKRRAAHVVGESDSVMSGWTGHSMDDEYSQNSNDDGKLGHTKGDVHMCSSATCEVCERKRQQGVIFIKTSTPPTPKRPDAIPNNATRDYVAEDVVAL